MVEITQHALKGQKLLAQGNALGIRQSAMRPEVQAAHLSSTPCFTLIEQALSAFFNVNYV